METWDFLSADEKPISWTIHTHAEVRPFRMLPACFQTAELLHPLIRKLGDSVKVFSTSVSLPFWAAATKALYQVRKKLGRVSIGREGGTFSPFLVNRN